MVFGVCVKCLCVGFEKSSKRGSDERDRSGMKRV